MRTCCLLASFSCITHKAHTTLSFVSLAHILIKSLLSASQQRSSLFLGYSYRSPPVVRWSLGARTVAPAQIRLLSFVLRLPESLILNPDMICKICIRSSPFAFLPIFYSAHVQKLWCSEDSSYSMKNVSSEHIFKFCPSVC